jgi:hypothetical protein
MAGRDVDDVVALLAQAAGDRPVAVRGDVQQDRPDALVLNFGNDRGQVLFGADDDDVADRPVARECRKVLADLRLDALLAVGPELVQAQLDTGNVSQRLMLLSAVTVRCRVIPVTTQQRQASTVPGQAPEQLQQARIIPGHRVTIASAMDSERAFRQRVTRVHEQRAAIQRDTVLPLRVTLPAHDCSRDR